MEIYGTKKRTKRKRGIIHGSPESAQKPGEKFLGYEKKRSLRGSGVLTAIKARKRKREGLIKPRRREEVNCWRKSEA